MHQTSFLMPGLHFYLICRHHHYHKPNDNDNGNHLHYHHCSACGVPTKFDKGHAQYEECSQFDNCSCSI